MSFGRDSHGIEGLSLDSVPLQPYRQESCPACNANPVWKQATLDALDGYSQGTKVSAEHLVAAMVSRVGSKKKPGTCLKSASLHRSGLIVVWVPRLPYEQVEPQLKDFPSSLLKTYSHVFLLSLFLHTQTAFTQGG